MKYPRVPPPGHEVVTCYRFTPPQPTDTPTDIFNHDIGNIRLSRNVDGVDEVLLYADGAMS